MLSVDCISSVDFGHCQTLKMCMGISNSSSLDFKQYGLMNIIELEL